MENLKTNPVAFTAQNKLLLVVFAILVVIFFLALPQIHIPRFGFWGTTETFNGSEVSIIWLSSFPDGLFIGIPCLAIIFLPILSAITLFMSKKVSLIFAYIATFAHIVLGITFSVMVRRESESSTVNRLLSEGLGVHQEDTLVYGWWLTLIVAIAWCVVFTMLKKKENNCIA